MKACVSKGRLTHNVRLERNLRAPVPVDHRVSLVGERKTDDASKHLQSAVSQGGKLSDAITMRKQQNTMINERVG